MNNMAFDALLLIFTMTTYLWSVIVTCQNLTTRAGTKLEREAIGGLLTRESGRLKYPRQSITPSLDMLAPVKISVTWKMAHTGDCIETGG